MVTHGIGIVVGLLLASAVAEAQFVKTPPTPPACKAVTCEGTPGRDGRKGRDGRDGRDGKDGRDAVTCPRVAWRPFDIGAHGLPLEVLSVVRDGCKVGLVVYNATHRIAALVDPTTGHAEVFREFSAHIPANERGPLTFDSVREFAPGWWLLWGHRGGWWLDQWPSGHLPVLDLSTIFVNDPRTGRPEAVFRWRDAAVTP